VTDRIGTLETKCAGNDITLTYSIGWIDYKPGDAPSGLINRAESILQLYKKASNASISITPLVR